MQTLKITYSLQSPSKDFGFEGVRFFEPEADQEYNALKFCKRLHNIKMRLTARQLNLDKLPRLYRNQSARLTEAGEKLSKNSWKLKIDILHI